MKYRIKRTTFICRNGKVEHTDNVVEVDDLERYRSEIKKPDHLRVNFFYEIID